MPKALPIFKFDADEWLTGKIQLLSAQEKGIFIDLVARIWKENGALKNTEVLPRLVRVPKATLAKSLDAFIQLGIMVEKDGFLSVKFVDAQLEARREYAEKQRVFGRMRGKRKKGTLTVASTTQVVQQGYPIEKKNPPTPPYKENITPPAGEIIAPARGKYPQSVDDVLKIAADPRCAEICDREQAKAYFLARDTTDWVDACGRRISPGKVYGDLKRWLMRDKSERAKNASEQKRRTGILADQSNYEANERGAKK